MLRRYHEVAVAELTNFFAARGGSRQLEPPEFEKYAKAVAGWATSLSVNGTASAISVVVDSRFPFSLPKLYLPNGDLCLKVPHVNDDGFICVTPGSSTFSQTRPKELMEYLLGEAEKVFSEVDRNEFVTEFQSYWLRQPDLGQIPFWSMVRPEGPSRSVAFFDSRSYTLLGDEIPDCRAWRANRTSKSEADKISFKTSMLLWFEAPIFPEEYPTTNRAVAALAKRAGEGAYDELLHEIAHAEGDLPVLLGFNTANGPALGGIWMREPRKGTGRKGDPRVRCKADGFRKGAVPLDVLEGRYFTDIKTTAVDVKRIDPAWIFSRSGRGYSGDLTTKTVAIVGCGSLGADVALLLAKAGVGKFVLVDGDTLEWGNVGRHLLGGKDVTSRKDHALSSFLATQLPYLSIKTFDETTWENAYEKSPRTFDEADLVVSTIGDWGAESALNILTRRKLDFPPVVFGWTEAFGCAGHGLAVLSSGGCLGCGMNELGIFGFSAASWPAGSSTLTRAPACGDFFQPYGVLEAAPVKSVIAELALDILLGKVRQSELRTWLGDTTHLLASGGGWRQDWITRFGDPGAGRRFLRSKWTLNPTCGLCTK